MPLTTDTPPRDTAPDAPATGEHGKRRGYRRLALVGAAAVGALLVFQLGLLGPARRLGVVPKPQRFTELYFPHPTTLGRLSTDSSGLLSFTVANREGEARTYPWTVVAALTGGHDRTVAAGFARISAGASRTVSVRLAPAKLAHATRLEVRLRSPSESIEAHLRQVRRPAPPQLSARRIEQLINLKLSQLRLLVGR